MNYRPAARKKILSNNLKFCQLIKHTYPKKHSMLIFIFILKLICLFNYGCIASFDWLKQSLLLYNITCLRHNTTSVTKDKSFKVLLNKRVFIFQFTAATKIEGWLIETVFLFKYFILTYVINSKQNFSIPNFISFIKVLFFYF